MNDKLKELTKDSFIYGVGQWISKLGGLVLVPILSRIFLPSDYGVIDLLNFSTALLLMIITLNIDTGVQKYYFLRNVDDRKTLLSSTGIFRFLYSSCLSIIFVIFSKDISSYFFQEKKYWIAISILAVSLPVADFKSQLMLLLRLNRNAFSFSFYNIVQVIIQPILTYVLVVNMKQSMDGVFMAQLATQIIIAGPLLLQQRKHYGKKVIFREAIDIMKFSLPGLPAIIQQNLMSLLPRYFLAGFSTLAAVGLYGIADKIANTIQMLRGSFNNAWNPFAFSNAGKADEKYLYEQAFRFFALCLLFTITTLAYFAADILYFLTPPAYHSAATLIGGLCFYYALRALTLIYSTGLYSVNKVSHTSILAMVQLTTFVISAIILTPYLGAVGLVISLDISAVIYFISYGLVIKKYFSFDFSSFRLIISLGLGMLGEVYVYYLSHSSYNFTNTSIFMQKTILLILFFMFSYIIVLKKNEREVIGTRIKSLFVST